MTPIERVARAIDPTAFGSFDGEPPVVRQRGKERQIMALKAARAAIEALREPSDAMLEAQFGQPSPADCWRAMIDAAIRGEGK